jgi:hypothetical protein
MDDLYEVFALKLRNINFKHKRSLYDNINWNHEKIIIRGAKGVGKSTLVLQYVKNNFRSYEDIIYISLDNIYFSANKLSDFVEKFYLKGGKHVIIDEIHKYPDWESEIEKVLKKVESLHIILVVNSVSDLKSSWLDSENFTVYELNGLSLREYITFNTDLVLPSYSFRDIAENHVEISISITTQTDPLAHFPAYLRIGYYPFFMENRAKYFDKLAEDVEQFIVSDLVFTKSLDFRNISKIKHLLYYLATNPAVKPNILKLSEIIGTTRVTVLQYIDYLSQGKLITTLKSIEAEVSTLAKPEQIYLNNTNLYRILFPYEYDKCLLNKTFVLNQIGNLHDVSSSDFSDFLVVGEYELTVGFEKIQKEMDFRNKKQIFAVENIEIGSKNKIPLWMFGFMY